MRIRLLVVVISLASSGTMAAADAGFNPWTAWMKDVWTAHDMNNDGGLSMDEVKQMSGKLGEHFVGFQPWYMNRYTELDANKDGIVTQEELHAMMEAHRMSDASMFKEWMRGGFGYIPFDPNGFGSSN